MLSAMSVRLVALCLALAVSGLTACGDSKDSSKPFPARTQLDGAPDSCELLFAAAPQTLLGVELAPAQRFYGLCLVQDKDFPASGAPEKSVGLEVRSDAAFVARNLDEFWEREGDGVGMAGGKREQVEAIPQLGDYAVWHPVDGGVRLFAYWGRQFVLVLTIRGVPPERALPWARELARAAAKQP